VCARTIQIGLYPQHPQIKRISCSFASDVLPCGFNQYTLQKTVDFPALCLCYARVFEVFPAHHLIRVPSECLLNPSHGVEASVERMVVSRISMLCASRNTVKSTERSISSLCWVTSQCPLSLYKDLLTHLLGYTNEYDMLSLSNVALLLCTIIAPRSSNAEPVFGAAPFLGKRQQSEFQTCVANSTGAGRITVTVGSSSGFSEESKPYNLRIQVSPKAIVYPYVAFPRAFQRNSIRIS
jgi:hypothetical protein